MNEMLSRTGKRWELPQTDSCDTATLIPRLMAQRGLATMTDTSWFDPSVYAGTGKAALRIREAVARREKIGLFGDYDCDGVTAVLQMLRYFRRHGVEPHVRLPHRMHDGYGLKPAQIDEFHASGCTLVVTVDTGVSAHEAIERARAYAIDVIVLDHHSVTRTPEAFAVVHPLYAHESDGSPAFRNEAPSAAGVVFSFLHALEDVAWADRDTDLVLATFGTVADLVKLTGANRQLVTEGLLAAKRLRSGPVHALMQHIAPHRSITATDIAFRIAPRINAAGRMSDPMLALRALMEGGEMLRTLESLNVERQEETSRCIEHALAHIETLPSIPAFLSVAHETYPPGILGLIAGKLLDRFGRPCMAANIQGDQCTASLRSTPQYNIVEGLERNAHLLTAFGGHAQAAGCSFPLSALGALTEALNIDVTDRVGSEHLAPTLCIDAMLSPSAITHAFCRSLERLEPHGQGNPELLFVIQNIALTDIRTVGADAKHLQARLGQIKAIGFHLGHLATDMPERLDIACRVGLNQWNGAIFPQLFLQDMRISAGIPARI